MVRVAVFPLTPTLKRLPPPGMPVAVHPVVPLLPGVYGVASGSEKPTVTVSTLPLVGLLSSIVIAVLTGGALSAGPVAPNDAAWLPAASRTSLEPGAVYATVKLPTAVFTEPSVTVRSILLASAPPPRWAFEGALAPEGPPGASWKAHGVVPPWYGFARVSL